VNKFEDQSSVEWSAYTWLNIRISGFSLIEYLAVVRERNIRSMWHWHAPNKEMFGYYVSQLYIPRRRNIAPGTWKDVMQRTGSERGRRIANSFTMQTAVRYGGTPLVVQSVIIKPSHCLGLGTTGLS
jgi:hypothetical protein